MQTVYDCQCYKQPFQYTRLLHNMVNVYRCAPTMPSLVKTDYQYAILAGCCKNQINEGNLHFH